LINGGQLLDFRAVQDTKSQGDHLHILGTSGGGDITGFGANIELDGTLKPRHQKVSTFTDRGGFHTLDTIENDGTVTTLD
jgi:hypothetical protein